jgi:hypothetical protein
MTRIVYLGFPGPQVTGGQKMTLRHVETLHELGFDAVYWQQQESAALQGFPHKAPTEIGTTFAPDDILVTPEDAPRALAVLATLPNRVVVFCQNQFYFASLGAEPVDQFPPERRPEFITPGRLAAEMVGRMYPQARIEVVPSFADERVFRPHATKRAAVVVSPRKRPLEARVIKTFFRKAHPRHASMPWITLDGATEAQVAEAFGSSALFLSLSRLEAAPITPLEAMASGCVCAGFMGVGGREHSNSTNGFWVADDDCEAAADALAQAADVVRAGGPAAARYREAGIATAAYWSYAAFRPRLEAVWMRLAPEARRRSAPTE